jgi:MYXO-CTERM domain-containing protein
MPARPLVFVVDATCGIAADPDALPGNAPASPKAASSPRSPRAGCCGAQTTPASPVAMTLVVLGLLLRRRRR